MNSLKLQINLNLKFPVDCSQLNGQCPLLLQRFRREEPPGCRLLICFNVLVDLPLLDLRLMCLKWSPMRHHSCAVTLATVGSDLYHSGFLVETCQEAKILQKIVTLFYLD